MFISGFSTVLEIPIGARNIYIRDLGENRNPLGNGLGYMSHVTRNPVSIMPYANNKGAGQPAHLHLDSII